MCGSLLGVLLGSNVSTRDSDFLPVFSGVEARTIARMSSPAVYTSDTVIVGGGQSGLAMSHCLQERGVDHVILEKGHLVERWRSERWDSLRLNTPNWMTRLPGDYKYRGEDPDGFMTAKETVGFFEDYAASFGAPVQTETEVVQVQRLDDNHFRVLTSKGTEWIACNLVVCTGFCDQPRMLAFAQSLSKEIVQVVPSEYKRARQIPPGKVLIIGASGTGCEIAEDLLDCHNDDGSPRFGEITMAVGTHTRLPRRYRDRDILHWLFAIGAFGPCDMSVVRNEPGPQIVGSPEHRDLDLGILQSRGVRLVGRATGLRTENGEQIVEFDDGLKERLTAAHDKMIGLLKKIDDYIDMKGIDVPPPSNAMPPVSCPQSPAFTELPLKKAKIRTIIWATGFRRDYPWLKSLNSKLLDENGEIVQDQGVTPERGLFVLGMRGQMTRISNFLDGVGPDAEIVAGKLMQQNKTV